VALSCIICDIFYTKNTTSLKTWSGVTQGDRKSYHSIGSYRDSY